MPPPVDQQQQQYQYVKLPDGSYGKFRSDASDDDIRSAVSKDFPDAFKQPEEGAGTRFWEGVKAGSGGENALNAKVDPAHPISTNPMIPGAGVYRDIKSGNYAGAAGRILGPGAILATALAGARSGEPVEPAISEGASGGGLKKLFTSPLRYASRLGESAVNQKLIPVKPLLNINTPADEAEALHIRMPMRDVGLSAPISDGLPEVEAARPSATSTLKSRIATERNLRSQPSFPRISEGLPEVEEGRRQATDLLHREISDIAGRAPVKASEPTEPIIPRITQKEVGEQLKGALGYKPLAPNKPIFERPGIKSPAPTGELPQGFTPVKSSAVKGFKYSPAQREFEYITKDGQHYVRGDVDDSAVQKFLQTAKEKGSYGKALSELRNNPQGGVGQFKVIGGKRVPVIKAKETLSGEEEPDVRTLRPDEDMTDALNKSIQLAKLKKSQK